MNSRMPIRMALLRAPGPDRPDLRRRDISLHTDGGRARLGCLVRARLRHRLSAGFLYRLGAVALAEHTDALVSPFEAGIACRCPRCGEGKLFNGFLQVADRCELDFGFA